MGPPSSLYPFNPFGRILRTAPLPVRECELSDAIFVHNETARPITGAHEQAEKWRSERKIILNPETQFTSNITDDFFEAAIAPTYNTIPCTSALNTIVPLFLRLAAPCGEDVARGQWNAMERVTGVSCMSTIKVQHVPEEDVPEDIPASLRRLDQNCRFIASRMREYATSPRRRHLTCIPVIHSGHFWLYVIDHDHRVLEYYNTIPGVPEGNVADALQELAAGSGGHVSPITSLLRRAQCMWPEEGVITVDDVGAEAVTAALLWFLAVYVGPGYSLERVVDRRVQNNTIDCGVFTCAYAYLRTVCGFNRIVLGHAVSQNDIAEIRRFIFSVCVNK